MFQDIAEDLCIEYDDSDRDDNDIVLAYGKGTVLCSVSNGELRLPRFCELTGRVRAVHAFRAGGKKVFSFTVQSSRGRGFSICGHKQYKDLKSLYRSVCGGNGLSLPLLS